jgi:CHAD domain-containing protein
MAKGVPIHKLTQPEAQLRVSSSVLLVRLNEMMEWSATIRDPECVEELHNMRIAAKRLRYTLEIFAPTLGADAFPLLAVITDIQEQIGAIHDCDMLFPLLSETLEREMEREKKQALRRGGGPPPYLAAEGLVALMTRKREERERRYREFIQFWDELPPESLAARFSNLVMEATDASGTTESAS